MSVRVLLFGRIAEQLGRRECALPADKATTLAAVLRAVGCDESLPLLTAVNLVHVSDMETRIRAGDEVAIMPPFSGG